MITVTDLFCGAGGSSLGMHHAGLSIEVAANHWAKAIEVHQSHFPNTRHDIADISAADPRRYPRTDILWASPECTNHSQAKGVSRKKQDPTLWDAPDPSAERSRATMWDVPRFAEQIPYAAIVVENVVDVTKWVFWPSWCMAMDALGYTRTVLSINSMHHDVAQSRDRVYVVLTRKGLNADLTQRSTAWCDKCETVGEAHQAWKNGRTVGKYRTQWIWKCIACATTVEPAWIPAASIIDWDLDCPRIGDRKKPLAKSTQKRILAGLVKHGWAPITTAGAGNTFERTAGNRSRPITDPVPTQATTAQTALGLPPEAFMVQTAHGGRLHDLANPHPTVCASDDRLSLVVNMRGTADGQIATSTRTTTEPLTTVTASGNHHGLLMRNNGTKGNLGWATNTTDEPTHTMTTKGHQSLLMPYNRTGQCRTTDHATPTMTTRDRAALIDPAKLINECGFRMLQPYEVAAAMGFPTGYIPTKGVTKKDQVKLAGNAVTPPVVPAIVEPLITALAA